MITLNTDEKLYFKNGKEIKNVEKATYLGGILSNKADPVMEIRKRISSTIPIVKKLELFWNKAKCNKK